MWGECLVAATKNNIELLRFEVVVEEGKIVSWFQPVL